MCFSKNFVLGGLLLCFRTLLILKSLRHFALLLCCTVAFWIKFLNGPLLDVKLKT